MTHFEWIEKYPLILTELSALFTKDTGALGDTNSPAPGLSRARTDTVDSMGYMIANKLVVSSRRIISDQDMDKLLQRWTKFMCSHPSEKIEIWQFWRYNSFEENNEKAKTSSANKAAIDELRSLLRRGVPSSIRGRVWWTCSGAGSKMMKAFDSGNEYNTYLIDSYESIFYQEEVLNKVKENMDLIYCNFASDDGFDMFQSISNILACFITRNPRHWEIKNLILLTAFLLVQFDEEQTFWVLCALIEDILPKNFYENKLLGVREETNVRLQHTID